MTAPTLGELRALRLKQGLSLGEAGALLGVHSSTVGGWERGRRLPAEEQVQAYAVALGWEPAVVPRPPMTISRGASAPVTDWQERAYCRGVDRDVFFPNDSDQAGQEKAKAFCRVCVVQGECLDWALIWGNDQLGIAGGMTAGERRAYRRQMNRHALKAQAS